MITWGNGRGRAIPALIMVAAAVRTACASAGCGLHAIGGIRISVRGEASGRNARHMIAPIASCLRATSEPCCTGMASEGSRYDGETGSEPAAASAAPTAGSNGAETRPGV